MKAQPTTKQLIEMIYERIPELFDRPQRPWVGLTDEEVGLIADEYSTLQGAIRAIEAKLRSKNGY